MPITPEQWREEIETWMELSLPKLETILSSCLYTEKESTEIVEGLKKEKLPDFVKEKIGTKLSKEEHSEVIKGGYSRVLVPALYDLITILERPEWSRKCEKIIANLREEGYRFEENYKANYLANPSKLVARILMHIPELRALEKSRGKEIYTEGIYG